MICKKCMTVMELGTSYEQRKGGDGKLFAKRFRKCKKCGEKVYVKEFNFQECMGNVLKKSRNK